MGKRSTGAYRRRRQDFYATPESAVLPLLPHLPQERTSYIEPCAGDGSLVRHLAKLAPQLYCVGAFDVEPKIKSVGRRDALEDWTLDASTLAEMWITNLPWSRPLLHRLIVQLTLSGMTLWTLLDADWSHTAQASPLLPLCHSIVAVGRVRWIEGSAHQGKDNCVWMRFGKRREKGVEIAFFGR